MSFGRLLVTKAINTLVWLALDVESGEIVGVFVGERKECRSFMAVAVATAACIGNVL